MDQLHGHVVVKHEDEAMLMHHAQDLHDPEDGVPPPLDAAVAVPEDIMADAVSAAAEVAEQVVNATAAATSAPWSGHMTPESGVESR